MPETVKRPPGTRRSPVGPEPPAPGKLLPSGALRPLDLDLRHVDRRDPALLHDQVAAEIRQAIANGEAGPGDRIPKARDLAAVMGVNTNTVLRALRLLRDEGLLELRRGHGTTVAGTPERSAVIEQARRLVALARRHGYRRDDLIRLVKDLSA